MWFRFLPGLRGVPSKVLSPLIAFWREKVRRLGGPHGASGQEVISHVSDLECAVVSAMMKYKDLDVQMSGALSRVRPYLIASRHWRVDGHESHHRDVWSACTDVAWYSRMQTLMSL